MGNLLMLISNNQELYGVKVKIENGCFVFRENNCCLDEKTIRNVIGFINTLQRKYSNYKLPVRMEFINVEFVDKLTYIMLECLCVYLIENCGYKVQVKISLEHRIHTEGFFSSPLLLLSKGEKINIEKFEEKFRLDIYKQHYRRVLSLRELEKKSYLCNLMDQIASFQKAFDVDEECREAITEVIVELVGNACEHGGANCLVDFDITKPTYRKKGTNNLFMGINIVVINFSESLLGTGLREKIQNDICCNSRDKMVQLALKNHSQFFDKDYCEEDFFNISAFQHKISRRSDRILGGTGLTKLIKSLETRSDAHMCYVMSGKRKLLFRQEYLTYNEDDWLGFNKQNDYLNSRPDESVFGRNQYMFPGTAYNLNFVMEKEL